MSDEQHYEDCERSYTAEAVAELHERCEQQAARIAKLEQALRHYADRSKWGEFSKGSGELFVYWGGEDDDDTNGYERAERALRHDDESEGHNG